MIYGFNSFYNVSGRVFTNKTLALLYANNNNIATENISWNFHDNEISSVDWKIEPVQSINDLYRTRAQMLREKYDYLILMCSGGPDSNNMAYSFLKNGIHVDEIIASAPLSGLKDWKDNISDTRTENVISETRFAQIPFIDEIRNNYPSVKITINDYFEDILQYDDAEWLIHSTDYIHPTTAARYSLDKFPHLRKLAETDRRIGVVYGIDKPFILIQGEKFINSISDYAVNVPTEIRKFKNFYNELFYFSHELPQIMIKQCHMLKRWLFLPENELALKLTRLNGKTAPFKDFNSGLYQRAIVPCIYPLIETKIWQAGKPKYNILADMDDWFYKKHNSLGVYDMMISNVNSIISKMRNDLFQYKDYYDGEKTVRYRMGLKGFYKNFLIGDINEK